MAQAKLDELVAWSFDARGRIDGFAGTRQPHRLSRPSRFLLPALDAGFAAPGDLLKIERIPFFGSEVSGLANLTQRRAETPDPLRSVLLAALVLALPFREGPEPDWVALLDRAYAGALEDHETVEMAALPVPDGKLLACEPFQIHEPRPYAIAVPPGTYPVFISIAAAPDTSDRRVAYAWIRIREGDPARWEPARTRGGADVEVGVDSGMAGFTSAAAAPRFVEAYDDGGRWGYVDPLSDALVSAMDEGGHGAAGRAVLDVGEARLVAFHSGFGDGVYPVYRALDARGRRLAVAMVFFVDR